MRVLGIDVDADLRHRWRGWLMPDAQPYLVPPEVAATLGLADEPARLTPELRDSFELYQPAGAAVAWLTRREARLLPPAVRAGQPAAHRWPSRDEDRTEARVVRYVEFGRRASRHRDVAAATWRAAGAVLPGARALAGRFPAHSGPNCFGAVLAAAGVAGAERIWMQREPFEAWLADRTRPGGSDDDLGTVLVWRSQDGLVQHAAVTLGDGWALHKPSQGWMSPTKVLRVRDVKLSSRTPGRHLHRHRLLAAPGRP
ncbi:hypothetical protein Athai_01360 [Actinocatenispora thailandica]|uniref:Uncharacterized protein n=1 Tax=Actinocatenispora thailandica TaxID=227318 RepID=A0A7R7HUY5_9ACTN|nr:hypothetical protein [Actinocatenispora thailandica]BCJ32633.1 hypothetical protein Athai_01360 [Actinocatenispora thailandica]